MRGKAECRGSGWGDGEKSRAKQNEGGSAAATCLQRAVGWMGRDRILENNK